MSDDVREVSETLAGAILTIDLGAIRSNYAQLKSLAPGVECSGVLKADAYGLGAGQVGAALYAEGCRTFFVAHIAEALSLKPELSDDARIFILNGLPPGAEADCAAAAVIPVMNCIEQIDMWSDEASRLGRKLPAAIQVDTGMSRMGLTPSEVDILATDPARLRGIETVLVMSHLACADDSGNPANDLQREGFDAALGKLPPAPASLANSSGIFLGPGYHGDLIRPGAALYGINPTPSHPNPMRQVLRLQAKVIQTREIGDDVGIGYGHAARSRAGSRLATISLGYADGWHRSGASTAFHNGVRLPFAGRVSMDSIILDITALPTNTLKPGDFVDLIGPDQTVDQVAEQAGTIGYEILTSLGSRFHRDYLGLANIAETECTSSSSAAA